MWFKNPTYGKFTAALIAIIIFQTTYFVTIYNNENKQEWIVFHTLKKTIIAERMGTKIILFGNDSILKNVSKNKMLKSYLIANFSNISNMEKLKNFNYFNCR